MADHREQEYKWQQDQPLIFAISARARVTTDGGGWKFTFASRAVPALIAQVGNARGSRAGMVPDRGGLTTAYSGSRGANVGQPADSKSVWDMDAGVVGGQGEGGRGESPPARTAARGRLHLFRIQRQNRPRLSSAKARKARTPPLPTPIECILNEQELN